MGHWILSFLVEIISALICVFIYVRTPRMCVISPLEAEKLFHIDMRLAY